MKLVFMGRTLTDEWPDRKVFSSYGRSYRELADRVCDGPQLFHPTNLIF